MKFQLLIRFLLIVFCLSMMIASAKAGINEGVEYYQKRQEGSKGRLASVENINKAIEHFSSAVLTPESKKDATLYLLKSYYYKAEFAVQNKEEKKKIFNMGKALGEKYIENIPIQWNFDTGILSTWVAGLKFMVSLQPPGKEYRI